MGASFSVALAQVVTGAVLESERLPSPSSFSEIVGRSLDEEGLRMAYMKDVNTIGISQRVVNCSKHRIEARFSRYGLPIEDRKMVWSDGLPPIIAFEIEWCPRGVLFPKVDTMRRL